MHYSEINIKPVERLRVVFMNNIREYLRGISGKEFLSIGFGWGNDLKVARALGFNVHGVDIDKNSVKKLSKEFDVKLMKGNKIPYKSGSFDVVFCDNVLEHMKEPSKQIAEMARVLKKGGKLVIVTPDPSQTTSYFSNFWADQTHIRPYHRVAVENLLKTHGFKIARSKVVVAYVPIAQAILTRLGLYGLYFAFCKFCNIFGIGIKEVYVIGVK
jgi:ubiquinone/menaquinone biosynthesis C-methylase UbiE